MGTSVGDFSEAIGNTAVVLFWMTWMSVIFPVPEKPPSVLDLWYKYYILSVLSHSGCSREWHAFSFDIKSYIGRCSHHRFSSKLPFKT